MNDTLKQIRDYITEQLADDLLGIEEAKIIGDVLTKHFDGKKITRRLEKLVHAAGLPSARYDDTHGWVDIRVGRHAHMIGYKQYLDEYAASAFPGRNPAYHEAAHKRVERYRDLLGDPALKQWADLVDTMRKGWAALKQIPHGTPAYEIQSFLQRLTGLETRR